MQQTSKHQQYYQFNNGLFTTKAAITIITWKQNKTKNKSESLIVCFCGYSVYLFFTPAWEF